MNKQTDAEKRQQNIHIRPATERDTGLILQFIKALAAFEKLADQVVADEDTLRASLFGDNPGAEVILAELDGAPVGFALFFHNYSTFLGQRGLYLEDLFVLESARGQGVGKALLQHLAGIARTRQCGRMEWWVLNWNKPAIDFYKSLRAEAMDNWTVYRMEGAALKALAEN